MTIRLAGNTNLLTDLKIARVDSRVGGDNGFSGYSETGSQNIEGIARLDVVEGAAGAGWGLLGEDWVVGIGIKIFVGQKYHFLDLIFINTICEREGVGERGFGCVINL